MKYAERKLKIPWQIRIAICLGIGFVLQSSVLCAQDFDAFERRLGGAVQDGEITLRQAVRLLETLEKVAAKEAEEDAVAAAKTEEITAATDGAAMDDKATESEPEVVGNPAQEIVDAFDASNKEWMNKVTNAPAAERRELMDSRPDPTENLDQMREFAKKHAGTEIQATALSYLLSYGNDEEEKEEAVNTLLEDFIESPSMEQVAAALARRKPAASTAEAYKKIIDATPHDNVKAAAAYYYSSFLDRSQMMAEAVDSLKDNPRAVEFYGEDGIKFLEEFEMDKDEMVGLYRMLANDYPDLVLNAMGREIKVGETAKAALFEMENLQVGCTAPDIDGSDLDGVDFKLSDYRGKVVMLDFWGDW